MQMHNFQMLLFHRSTFLLMERNLDNLFELRFHNKGNLKNIDTSVIYTLGAQDEAEAIFITIFVFENKILALGAANSVSTLLLFCYIGSNRISVHFTTICSREKLLKTSINRMHNIYDINFELIYIEREKRNEAQQRILTSLVT